MAVPPISWLLNPVCTGDCMFMDTKLLGSNQRYLGIVQGYPNMFRVFAIYPRSSPAIQYDDPSLKWIYICHEVQLSWNMSHELDLAELLESTSPGINHRNCHCWYVSTLYLYILHIYIYICMHISPQYVHDILFI